MHTQARALFCGILGPSGLCCALLGHAGLFCATLGYSVLTSREAQEVAACRFHAVAVLQHVHESFVEEDQETLSELL